MVLGTSVDASPMMAATLVALGAFFFSLMGLFVKLAEHHAECSIFSLFAVRSAIGLLLNSFAVFWDFGKFAVDGRRMGYRRSRQDFCSRLGAPPNKIQWVWLSVRVLAGFASICFEYAALAVLPLATNTMIVYSSPAFIVLWAALLLHERIRAIVMVCICVCFCGLTLIVRPWSQNLDAPVWAYAFSGVAAVLAGLAYVSLKELKRVKYHFVLNVFMFVSLILSVVVGVIIDEFPLPPWNSIAWGHLCGVGLSAYAAEVCITIGFAKATPETLGQVSVLKFLSPLFSLMWGFVFLAQIPTAIQFIGMALVTVASAFIVLLRSNKKKMVSQDTWSSSQTDESCSVSCESCGNHDVENPEPVEITNPEPVEIANPEFDIANPDSNNTANPEDVAVIADAEFSDVSNPGTDNPEMSVVNTDMGGSSARTSLPTAEVA